MRLGGGCQVVEDGLGLSWSVLQDPYGEGFTPLVSLALRDNPKRAQLVVSTVRDLPSAETFTVPLPMTAPLLLTVMLSVWSSTTVASHGTP